MIGVTIGGIFIGLALLVWELSLWHDSIKALQANPVGQIGELAPFSICWCIGALTVMVGSGLVGWIGDTALWGMNTFGDGVLIFGVGAHGGTAPGSNATPLTEGGLFMTGLVITCFLARRKKGATSSKWRGWFSGIGLGLASGVARYAAVPLASAANASGVWLTGMVS